MKGVIEVTLFTDGTNGGTEVQMLRGQYEVVQVAGSSLTSAIKRAVAAFQGKHGGRLPQYVWCPEGEKLAEDVVQSWAVRGVIVAPHKNAQGGVFAGPVDAEVVACRT